jgi:hypothetical protein
MNGLATRVCPVIRIAYPDSGLDPYTPPALDLDRLARIDRDLNNGLTMTRNDAQALISEVHRLRGYLIARIS